MKILKRSSVVLVALSMMVFGLAACGSKEDTNTDTTKKVATTEKTENTEEVASKDEPVEKTEDTKDVFSSDNSENDLEEDYLADADGDNVIIWKSQCSYHSCEQ